jgi:hypothetical protein
LVPREIAELLLQSDNVSHVKRLSVAKESRPLLFEFLGLGRREGIAGHAERSLCTLALIEVGFEHKVLQALSVKAGRS